MTLVEATAALRQGIRSMAAIVPYDPKADLAALGRLAEHCDCFSPVVGWDTLTQRLAGEGGGLDGPWFGEAPEHLFIDVTGAASLFGGEEALAGRVVAECRQLGFAASVAIAETLGAAWAVAGYAKPCTTVPPEELAAALQPLPVAELRLAPDVLTILSRLGLHTIGQVRQLSRGGLADRLGRHLVLRLDQALGCAPEVIVPHRPPPAYEAAYRLEIPTDRRDVLDWLLVKLLERICKQLCCRGVGAVRLTGQLDCGIGPLVPLDVGLFRPMADAAQLWNVLRLQCDRMALPGPVEGIRLRAVQTAPLRPYQDELFVDSAKTADRQVGTLVERLASRLGAAAIVRPQLQADALPERAFCYEKAAGRWRPSSRRPQAVVGERPLRLFDPPRPIVVSMAGDKPVGFRWQRQSYTVARLWGPERIETGWWRHGLVRRDYYRVETDAGCRLWLFRDLNDYTWRLHGSFE